MIAILGQIDGWTDRYANPTYQQNSKQQLCMRTKFSRKSGPTTYDVFEKWIKLHNEIENPCS